MQRGTSMVVAYPTIDLPDREGLAREDLARDAPAERSMMMQWYVFRAPTGHTLYGFGSPDQAKTYVDHLNEGHSVNAYGATAMSQDEIDAVPQITSEGLNLGQAIEELDREGGVD